MSTVNPCDPQDEREAAGVETKADVILDVDKLRGLSRLIADRTIEALEREVNTVKGQFNRLLSGAHLLHRRISLRVLTDRARPDPEDSRYVIIEFDPCEALTAAGRKAVEVNRSERVAKALKSFLAEHDSFANDIDELRSEVPE